MTCMLIITNTDKKPKINERKKKTEKYEHLMNISSF